MSDEALSEQELVNLMGEVWRGVGAIAEAIFCAPMTMDPASKEFAEFLEVKVLSIINAMGTPRVPQPGTMMFMDQVPAYLTSRWEKGDLIGAIRTMQANAKKRAESDSEDGKG